MPGRDQDVAPLPPGTPFERQQFHALMLENGVIPWSTAQAEELATKLRSALPISVA